MCDFPWDLPVVGYWAGQLPQQAGPHVTLKCWQAPINIPASCSEADAVAASSCQTHVYSERHGLNMQRDINFLEQRPAFKNRNSTEHQGYFLRPARRLWFNDCESPVDTTHRKLNFGNISGCVFTYVHLSVCVYTYIWVSVRTYVCLCVCMHVCIFPRKLLKSLNTAQSQSEAQVC